MNDCSLLLPTEFSLVQVDQGKPRVRVAKVDLHVVSGQREKHQQGMMLSWFW